MKNASPATGDTLDKQADHINNLPVKLSVKEYTELESVIPDSSRQFKRMVKHLADNPDSETTKVCIACASVNLSDVARKHNDLIAPKGLAVACRTPPYTIRNRFGERSNQFLWGLYRIGEV